jgi:hypothetical protein
MIARLSSATGGGGGPAISRDPKSAKRNMPKRAGMAENSQIGYLLKPIPETVHRDPDT